MKKAKKWPEAWHEVNVGAMVFEPCSAREYHTGSWRARRPVWDNTRCIRCGLCYIYCPEGCVSQNALGYFEADLNYCKGCGICAHECWPTAIAMVEEA
ncbi:MAG: 4Fe-4S binding protein [Deltaproteobacteria bacterium]|nr:4Fe-4S binding protein [Deltaproteobacteria bacterium]